MGLTKYLARGAAHGIESLIEIGANTVGAVADVGMSAAKHADKIGGFAYGAFGYSTGLKGLINEIGREQPEKFLSKEGMKQFGRMFKNTSGHSSKMLGAADMAQSMVKKAEAGAEHSFFGYTLSPLGKVTAAGVVAYAGVKSVAQDVTKTNMGQVAPGKQQLESTTYDYDGVDPSRQTGADGNLVFALNKLRSR